MTAAIFNPAIPTDDDLVDIYADGGPFAVFAFARQHHPEWIWELCPPCEDVTPTWDGICAVCFHARPKDIA